MQSQRCGRRVFNMVATPWILAGGSPAASHFSCFAKKSNQKEGDRKAVAFPSVRSPNVAGISRVEKQTRYAQTSFPTIPD